MRKRAAASSRAQISSQKRPRRKKTADDGAPPPGLSSSCTTQIQAPLKRQRKRNAPPPGLYSSDVACLRPCPIADAQVILSSPSWGAKRGRTAVRKRDWAYLDDGPVGLIAERVLANDVADYIRFRAVCLPWRRFSADTRGRGVLDDPRFHPRSWIMLVGDRRREEELHQFLNTSTGQCIQVAIPELRDHRVLPSTAAEGLLFLLCMATAAVRLLNPLTRQMAELPPITDLGLPDTAGLADDRTVLLYFDHDHGETLAFAKPGNESWVLVKTNTELISPVSCAGRFYGVTSDAIMTVDMTGGPPRLVVAAKMDKRMRYGSMTGGTVHLVDNGGELVLVHWTHRTICDYDATPFGIIHETMYKVYRIDQDRGRMVPTTNLRGRAVFIDKVCETLSVAPQVSPLIDANTIYSSIGLGEYGAYNLRRDGRSYGFLLNNKQGPGGLIGPWSIADCLAAHVRA